MTVCQGCEQPITGRYSNAKWCSDACRVRARRRHQNHRQAADTFWDRLQAVTRPQRLNKDRTRRRGR